jgi:hypothetical protein
MSHWATILTVLLMASIVFGFAMLCMGVGVLFKRRALRGHCGGGDHPVAANGEFLRCDACPNSDDPNAGPCEDAT